MKKAIFICTLITTIAAGMVFTGCESSTQEMDNAQANVEEAKQDLKEARQDVVAVAQKTANAEAWRTFKSESEVKIRGNETRIAELKEKMKTSGKTLDAVYEKNIDLLEQKNKDLNARMVAYEKEQSDWESFKREFNHDMDELGKALKDFTLNNQN